MFRTRGGVADVVSAADRRAPGMAARMRRSNRVISRRCRIITKSLISIVGKSEQKGERSTFLILKLSNVYRKVLTFSLSPYPFQK